MVSIELKMKEHSTFAVQIINVIHLRFNDLINADLLLYYQLNSCNWGKLYLTGASHTETETTAVNIISHAYQQNSLVRMPIHCNRSITGFVIEFFSRKIQRSLKNIMREKGERSCTQEDFLIFENLFSLQFALQLLRFRQFLFVMSCAFVCDSVLLLRASAMNTPEKVEGYTLNLFGIPLTKTYILYNSWLCILEID